MEQRSIKIRNHYDLIIVGGGIYGATLLWEATLRGFSAILVEKGDFCSGTSSNSLKIIHGGMRYLQNLDFKRLRESLKERKILMRIAPHLVHPICCITPTRRNLKESRRIFQLAFLINQLVGFDQNRNSQPDKFIPFGRLVSASEFEKVVTDSDGLPPFTGGAIWYDAQVTNSERLVLAFIISAMAKGSNALNYMEMKSLIVSKDGAMGIIAHDRLQDQDIEIRGDVTINNTGPWTNEFCKKLPPGCTLEKQAFAKAVNLIIPRKLSDCAIGLRTLGLRGKNSRLLFFVPWRDTTMIGTWYFEGSGDPDRLSLTEEELNFCVREAKEAFPSACIVADEICFVHLGMVPLAKPHSANRERNIARHYQIRNLSQDGAPSGVLSVLGVKYTTARDVAAKTINLVTKMLGIKPKDQKQASEWAPLKGGEMISYSQLLSRAMAEIDRGLSHKNVRHLVGNYGTDYKAILALLDEDRESGEQIPGSDEVIRAELLYSIRNEFPFTLSDLMLRRLDLGSHRRPKDETIAYCADLMAKECGWNEQKKQSEIEAFLKTYQWVH